MKKRYVAEPEFYKLQRDGEDSKEKIYESEDIFRFAVNLIC